MARRFLPPASESAPPAPALDWLIACTALTLAPLALWQPLWMPAAGLALLGWRALAARRHWRLPGRWLRLALMVVLVAAVYRQYGTLFGRNPGVALLGLLAALKLFELERLRDYLLGLFLLFLLVAGSFLYSQSLWLASYQLITVIAALATLVRLTQPDLESPYAALRLTLGLLARAIPIILILYLLFPRIQGTLWGLPVDAYGGVTGVSDEMHPGSVNFLSQSEEVAFRASFANGASPPAQRLYWRVLVLWDTDGRSWLRGPTPSWPAAALAPSGPALDYTITLEPTQATWLPALDWPVAAGAAGRFTPALTVEGAVVRERRQYALRAWPEIRAAALDPRERERALRLAATSARVRALVADWQRAGGGDMGVVERALAHFRNEEFIYTLQPPELGDDAVDEFLFETRRGFCEHYTAAFVTLMRTAGIPSRVVLGYQGGETNPAGDYLIVRQSDAHAWAEVWLEGRGWTRVDPTAAIAPERIEYGASALRRLYGQGLALGRLPPETLRSALRLAWLERWRERGRLGWDALNNAWNRWVLGYDQRRQRDLLRDFGLEAPSWSVLAGWLALASVALLALLALPWIRARGGGDRVQDAYLRYCRKLARIGLARAPQEGPLDYARRCVRRRPDLRAAVEAITGRYVSLRYGERGGRQARRELRGLVRQFRPARLAR